MLKYIYALFFVLVILGMWMIFHFGIKPKSVKVIKPSFFEKPQELGALVHKVLYPRTALHTAVFFGKQLGDVAHDQVFEGYVQAAQSSDHPFQKIITLSSQYEGIIPNNVNAEVVDLQSGGDLNTQLEQSFKNNQRVLVYMNSLETVHFESQSVVRKLQEQFNKKIISISTLNLSKTPEEESLKQIEICQKKDDEYVHSLGCLQQNQNQFAWRNKKMKWEKFVGIMDQEGELDYVLYIRPMATNP